MFHVWCTYKPSDAGHEYANLKINSKVKTAEVVLVATGGIAFHKHILLNAFCSETIARYASAGRDMLFMISSTLVYI